MQPSRFQHPIHLEPQHIDDLGHVNNVVYLQWVQDTAAAHWQQEASEAEQQQYRWVVLRHEIDYLKPALPGDELTGFTWVEKMAGVKSYRRVEIRRGEELLAGALTIWVMISAEDGRPMRIPEELSARFLTKTV